MKEKMKATRYILAGIVLPMMFAGCLDEYQKLNTDPEQLGTTDPRYVFTGATMNFTNQSRSREVRRSDDLHAVPCLRQRPGSWFVCGYR